MAAGKLLKEGIEAIGQFALPKVEKKIRGYHGTPHSFDKFSMDKIGTGEGAQAYGHGLYFAENEGIAKSYRDTLGQPTPVVDGVDLFTVSPAAAHAVIAHNGDVGSALNHAKTSPYGDRRLVPVLEGLVGKPVEMRQGGSMYEVNINADPETFLDWDKPLSEQSQQVRGAIGHKTPEEMAAIQREIDGISQEEEAILSTYPDINIDPDGFAKAAVASTPENTKLMALGERRLGLKDQIKQAQQLSDPTLLGQSYLRGASSTGRHANNPDQTKGLLAKGIPGIKYLDAGSRQWNDTAKGMIANYGTREKALEVAQTRLKQSHPRDEKYWQDIVDQLSKPESRNYVVFDENLISIVKKYGIAGALGAGLISPDDAKAAEQQGLGGPSDTFEGPEGTFSTPKADRLPLAASMSKQDRVPASQEGRIKEAGQMFAEVPQAMTTGLREAGESALGMGGDMGEYLPGIGPAVTASKALLPSSLNPFKTTEDAAAMTDWLQGYLPEGAQAPIKEWTQHEDTSPMDWMYRNIVANAVDPMDIGLAAGASKLGRMGLAKLKGLF